MRIEPEGLTGSFFFASLTTPVENGARKIWGGQKNSLLCACNAIAVRRYIFVMMAKVRSKVRRYDVVLSPDVDQATVC
jgi:hypothetical protein